MPTCCQWDLTPCHPEGATSNSNVGCELPPNSLLFPLSTHSIPPFLSLVFSTVFLSNPLLSLLLLFLLLFPFFFLSPFLQRYLQKDLCSVPHPQLFLPRTTWMCRLHARDPRKHCLYSVRFGFGSDGTAENLQAFSSLWQCLPPT